MPDMLVHLLKIERPDGLLAELREKGVVVRRANAWEMTPIREFILKHFGAGWADEVIPAYSRQPTSLFIAIRDGKVIGFGAFDATRRGFFGPTGVAENERGTGVGKALLLACLIGMREAGYVYGIIGGAGPVSFYEKCCAGVVIPDSVPGIYTDMLTGQSA